MPKGCRSQCFLVAAFLLTAYALTVAQTGTAHLAQTFGGPARSWLQHVRIAAYSLTPTNATTLVNDAAMSHVYGIEVDNDIPGRYETLLHPEEKLAAIRRVAVVAHQHRNKSFVYVAGLECISSNAEGPHTLAKDHPEWLQRKRTAEPAIFDHHAAFWIAKGEEDAWVSPYAAAWRTLYMQRIRQIAATGIDGIYVDIPYWMTHFTGWEDSWASFDDATVSAFRKQTGLDARKDIRLGDFNDPAFHKWVDFRIRTITDFLVEIRANATAVNPDISVIPEIYPGIEEEAVRVGADVYQIYPHVDAIAHEYEFGSGEDHTAASRSPFDWMMYQVGLRSFHAFAGDRATWILNYSWDGAPKVAPRDAMLNLAMSELAAGASLWDAKGHVMSGSNDIATRSEIYAWVAKHEDIFSAERKPIGDVGVYFSDETRNRSPKEAITSYRGVMLLLLQAHVQFQVVTGRTLSEFHGNTLVLPDVRMLNDTESVLIHRFHVRGGSLILTGLPDDRLRNLGDAIRFPARPEVDFLHHAEAEFGTPPTARESVLLHAMDNKDAEIQVTAPPSVVAHAAYVRGTPSIFFVNFTGLKAGDAATPAAQSEIHIRVPSTYRALHVLPFLGDETTVLGKRDGNRTVFLLPRMERGSVAWLAE